MYDQVLASYYNTLVPRKQICDNNGLGNQMAKFVVKSVGNFNFCQVLEPTSTDIRT